MSRYYQLEVRTIGTTEEDLYLVCCDKFGWSEESLDDTNFIGEGCLCGGKSEEEAHEEISKAIKEIKPEAKVKTQWTYLEDLPYETYGDDIE